MPHVTVENQVQIYYEEYGTGDRYLICTQVGHGRYSLEKEMAKRGFHVFLLTNRGFGRSTHVTEDYGDYWYERFADDVVAFADQMKIDRFAYSGASHGAGTGWHVVLKYPERVNCFFAVVPGPHNLDEGKLSVRAMGLKGMMKPLQMTMPTEDARLLARRQEEREAGEAQRAEPDYEAIYNSPETRAIDYGRPLRALQTEAAVQEALKTIQVPVLIMGGMEDVISRPDLMVRSARCVPHCKLVVHSGFGHTLDIYEELADEAVRFYENVEQTGYYYAPVVTASETKGIQE